ncbi:ABC transporter permease [Roseivirga sp.]|uniref:ABC transporter permease n=1 Tax=Roseivirga sp. TaxID=1964215 RepID=UPI003B8EA980
MLIRNIKLAIRQLSKNKVFSIVNVFGLALSMVACLLIYKYVSFEKSYDQYHAEADNIYRIYRVEANEDPDDGVASVFSGMKIPLEEELPEIKHVARFIGYDKIFQSFAFTYNGLDDQYKTYNVSSGFFSDQDAIKIIDFKWKEGVSSSVSLNNPFELIISEKYAKLFFGDAPALGKVLRFKNLGTDFKVTGVFKDLPENTHIKFEMLCSMKSLPANWNLDNVYNWGNFYTYIKTAGGASPRALESKINELFAGIEGAWFDEDGVTMKLQNIQDIHLNSHHSYEIEANGNGDTVTFLSIIGVFIMVIAWVNYINLSSSKLVDRAKEVGIRKVMGGYKRQLMGQFLMESFTTNFFAIIISLTLLQLTRSFFEGLIGIPITFFEAESLFITLAFIAAFPLGSIIFGFYPALLFSSQKVSIVLNGKSKTSKSGLLFRRGLTLFQYVIALVLIVGTLAVKKQLLFMQNQSLGMNIDRTLVVKKPFMEMESRFSSKASFMNSVNQMSEVLGVSASSEIPGYEISRMRWIALGPGSDDKALYAKDIAVDEFFTDLYEIDVIYGRSFSKGFSDSTSVVLSHQTAKELLGEDNLADWIGKTIYYETLPYRLIGIVDDISQESLKVNRKPHIYTKVNRDKFYSIKLNSDNMSEVVSEIQTIFDRSFTTSHFEYFFLDEYYDRQYKADRLFGQIFSFFSILAIIITALGLFGLSLYNISQRAREIGIRKILGAPVNHIFYLLTKEYALLISLASVIGLPIGYYFIQKWLVNFSSHMDITTGLLVLPIALLFFLTLGTICYQVIKAIRTNPADTLRYE